MRTAVQNNKSRFTDEVDGIREIVFDNGFRFNTSLDI